MEVTTINKEKQQHMENGLDAYLVTSQQITRNTNNMMNQQHK